MKLKINISIELKLNIIMELKIKYLYVAYNLIF